MVRVYKRKTSRENISEEQIKSAVIDVIVKKRAIRSTAAKFCMPYSTLYSRVEIAKKCNESFDLHNIVTTKAVGVSKNRVRQIFSDEEENELKKYLTISSNICYGLSYMQTRTLAYEFAKKLNKNYPVRWNEKSCAGIDWLSGFMKRHPLSLRKPENTSVARATAFNKENVELFFKNYSKVLQDEKFTPERIYNLDETSVPMVLQAPNVIAPTGKKQVGKIVSAERGESITLCGIINATGSALPPVLIFPRVNFKDAFLTSAPAGSLGMASKTGYMKTDIFLNVLKHIQSHTQCTNLRKILLLIDNVKCHISVEAMIYARDNGIVILSFHPHTTHRMQPLDVGVFGPFKTYLKTSFDNFLTAYPGKVVSIYNVAGLLRDPYLQAFTPKNIQNSFMKPGIWPLNQLAFTDEDFLPSYATDRPITNETVQAVTESVQVLNLDSTDRPNATEIVQSMAETLHPIDLSSVIDLSNAELIFEFSLDDILDSSDIITSSGLVDINSVSEYEVFENIDSNISCQTTQRNVHSLDTIETGNVLDLSAKGTETKSQENKAPQRTLIDTLEEIRPYPKAGPRKVSNRAKVKSTVYTNLDEIQKLVTARARADLKWSSKKQKDSKVPDSALLDLLLQNPGSTAEEIAGQINMKDEYFSQQVIQAQLSAVNSTNVVTNSTARGARKRIAQKPRKPKVNTAKSLKTCQFNIQNKYAIQPVIQPELSAVTSIESVLNSTQQTDRKQLPKKPKRVTKRGTTFNQMPGDDHKPSKKRATRKPGKSTNADSSPENSASTQDNNLPPTPGQQSVLELLRAQIMANFEIAKQFNLF